LIGLFFFVLDLICGFGGVLSMRRRIASSRFSWLSDFWLLGDLAMTDSKKPNDKTVWAYSDLFLAMGAAIAQFADIEESLAALFGTAAGIPHIQTAFRIHDEIREFQYRLGTTDVAVRTWIAKIDDDDARQTFSTEWNALHRKIKEDSEDRNRIAHSKIAPDEREDGTCVFYVCPYFQFFSHLDAIKQQPSGQLRIPQGVRKYDLAAMRAKADRFLKTQKRIDRFIGGMNQHGTPLPKFS
jgi:hypothetical protein